jgi:DNA transposition AAA+ family ATPase
MSSAGPPGFVETLEYRRFAEFCDACRRYRYVGLCYGRPGVGKTLSARRYTRWEQVEACQKATAAELEGLAGLEAVLYTAAVVNTPQRVSDDIKGLRRRLRDLAEEPLRRQEEAALERVRQQSEELAREIARNGHRWVSDEWAAERPTEGTATRPFYERCRALGDPTRLVIVDEADRLKTVSLEQVREVFDAGDVGLVLIGIPGLEKRLARYPQFYSRIGFVHEYRSLGVSELRQLLGQGWKPPGVQSAGTEQMDDEAVAAVIRITGGNFRLLDRLLTQVERVLEINRLSRVTRAVVEAAREGLVIGAV